MPLRFDEIEEVKVIVKAAAVDKFDSKPIENKIKALEKLIKELESDIQVLKKENQTKRGGKQNV